MSAAEVQRLAHLAPQDEQCTLERISAKLQRDVAVKEERSSVLKSLASLGDWGRYHGNCRRDLLKLLGQPSTPEPLHAPIENKILKPKRFSPKTRHVMMPFLLPHVNFAYMFSDHKHLFNSLFLGAGDGGENKVRAFCEGVTARRDPRRRFHPMCKRQEWEERAVPISLHGDAVPCVGIGKPHCNSFDADS
mgnify:CR=1 FL=1